MSALKLLQELLGDRGKYVAVLTIARTYAVHGMPERLPETPSYAAWSNLVRSPLVWLGMTDPIDTVAHLRSSDPIRGVLGWAKDLKTNVGYIAPELAQEAERFALDERQHPDLWHTLYSIAAARGAQKIETKRLGRWLAKNTNNIAGGYRLPDYAYASASLRSR